MMQNSLVSQKGLARIVDFLSQSKLSNVLAGLIIFFSATQLGYHFWPLSSLVYGIRIDYLSPTVYFLDTLIILFLVIKGPVGSDPLRKSWLTWDWRSVLERNSWLQAKKGSAAAERTVLMGAFPPIFLTNLLYSQNPLSTLSWSLRLILYIMFIATIRSDLVGCKSNQKPTRSDLEGVIYSALTLSLLFQTIIVFTQVYLGHSVGGLMYYLGERNIAVGSPGIALGTFMDHVVLRAYGTFGHPNVLAGWAVISLLIILHLRGQSSQGGIPATKGSDLKGRPEPRDMQSAEGQTLWVPLISVICIVFLTQSRSVALALFGFIIPFYLIKKFELRVIYLLVSLLVCWHVYPLFLSPPRSDLSLTQRIALQRVSLSVIHSFPGFGAGANASISSYPLVASTERLLQPDHNSFTLFLSWFGFFGVTVILYSLHSFYIRYSIFSVLPLLPLLLLDHYLLTSPQGLFIFLTYLAVAVNYSHAKENI